MLNNVTEWAHNFSALCAPLYLAQISLCHSPRSAECDDHAHFGLLSLLFIRQVHMIQCWHLQSVKVKPNADCFFTDGLHKPLLWWLSRSDGQQVRSENNRLAFDVIAPSDYRHLPVICIFREGELACLSLIVQRVNLLDLRNFQILGPKLMENRKPFKLRNVLVVYNFAQVLFSLWLFYEASSAGWFAGYSYRCQPVDTSRSPIALRVKRN